MYRFQISRKDFQERKKAFLEGYYSLETIGTKGIVHWKQRILITFEGAQAP